MASENEDYVLFEDSEGNTISNDPRWHAKQRLAQSGVDVDSLEDENERLRRQLAELMAQRGVVGASDDDDLNEPTYDVDAEGNRTYKDLDSKALVNEMKNRNLPLSHEDGSKLKAGEAREALVADDAAKREAE